MNLHSRTNRNVAAIIIAIVWIAMAYVNSYAADEYKIYVPIVNGQITGGTIPPMPPAVTGINTLFTDDHSFRFDEYGVTGCIMTGYCDYGTLHMPSEDMWELQAYHDRDSLGNSIMLVLSYSGYVDGEPTHGEYIFYSDGRIMQWNVSMNGIIRIQRDEDSSTRYTMDHGSQINFMRGGYPQMYGKDKALYRIANGIDICVPFDQGSCD